MSKEQLSAAVGRRAVLGGIAGVAGAAAAGRPLPARAATDLVWLGWQGYEGCLKAGSFLQDHDLAPEGGRIERLPIDDGQCEGRHRRRRPHRS